MDELLRRGPCGGSCAEPDRHAFVDRGGSLDRNGMLFRGQLRGLELKAGLVGAGIAGKFGPAMNAFYPAGFLEGFYVTPDGHGETPSNWARSDTRTTRSRWTASMMAEWRAA